MFAQSIFNRDHAQYDSNLLIKSVLKIVISMLVNFVAMNRQTDSLQNSQIDLYFGTGSFEPQALVVDPTTGHLIYSAVSSKSYIGILNMETKERKTVVPGLTSVYNIAIYPKKG